MPKILNSQIALRCWLYLLVFLIGAQQAFADGSQAESETKGIEVVKSANDQRNYRYLDLENGLKVLLISDKNADKAAASLDVSVGSNDNPEDHLGLAHFLEHMLFLGTGKYPKAGEYQEFIASHGGTHNAYTSDEHTNYFFDIEQASLQAGLDRFAQFFIDPLFTPQYVDRERNAVHSEYRAKLKDDNRRQYDVFSEILSPKHPQSKFAVGNLDTLANSDSEPLRDDLLAFYQRYYSADNMALTVLGRESLDDLQAMVVPLFSQVPEHPTAAKISGQEMFNAGDLPGLLQIQSLQDQRGLTLIFPMPLETEDYRAKPMAYLGSILGHEGEGSLLSLLKLQGWAQSLAAGGANDSRNQQAFTVSIDLTPSGYEHYREVIAATFAMINKLQDGGIKRWRFDEMAQLSEIAFDNMENAGAMQTVMGLSTALQEYPPEDLLRGPYAFDSFNKSMIETYLDKLNPENLLVILTAPDGQYKSVSKYYDTAYTFSPLKEPLPELSKSLLAELDLPQKNPFIPESLAMKSTTGDVSADDVPERIDIEEGTQLWFKQDQAFSVPKADVRLRIRTAAADDSPRAAAISQLFASLVQDSLNEYAYPAQLAGLYFSFSPNSRGFDLSLGGYDDRMSVLLKRILKTLDGHEFDPQRVDILRDRLIRRWRNETRSTPYQQLVQKLPVLLYSPLWDDQALATALADVDADDLQKFAESVWNQSQIRMMVYGNFERKEAVKLGKLAARHLHRGGDQAADKSALIVRLPNKEQTYFLPVEHTDTASMLYLQAPDDSIPSRAQMLLNQEILSPPFFHELRTEQQLGYIVFATGYPLKDIAGNLLLVQSPSAGLSKVRTAMESFLREQVDQKTVADYTTVRSAVVANLAERPKNLKEQGGEYWDVITSDDQDFAFKEKLIAAVKSIDEADYLAFRRQLLTNSGRLWLTAGETAPADSVTYDSEKSYEADKQAVGGYRYR